MTDLLKAFEKAAKAVRGGILAASGNLAFLVSDACRTPEKTKDAEEAEMWRSVSGVYAKMDSRNCGRCGQRRASHSTGAGLCLCEPPDSATTPPVVAPSPKQGSDSPPRDSAILQAPSGGTQTSIPEPNLSHDEIRQVREILKAFDDAAFLMFGQK